MPRIIEHVELASTQAGPAPWLVVYRWGQRGSRPKAYIEGTDAAATTHLTAWMSSLESADDACHLVGEVVLVPHGNVVDVPPQAATGVETLDGLPDLSGRLADVGVLNGSLLEREIHALLLRRARPATPFQAWLRARHCLALDADLLITVGTGPDLERASVLRCNDPSLLLANGIQRVLGSHLRPLRCDEDPSRVSLPCVVSRTWEQALHGLPAGTPLPVPALRAALEVGTSVEAGAALFAGLDELLRLLGLSRPD